MDILKQQYDKVLADMRRTPQNDRQSVYDHCQSVTGYGVLIWKYLINGEDGYLQRENNHIIAPDWLKYYRVLLYQKFQQECNGADFLIYLTMHDCGKPYCRTVDENGKQHFPNHVQESIRVATELNLNEQTIDLIAHDMDFHTLKPEGIDEFSKLARPVSLMISGLAEIHANAEMFGGIDSQGFKIKWETMRRRGRVVCFNLFKV